MDDVRLETGRLVLREFEAKDMEAVYRYQQDPLYLRYYPWEGRTREEVEAFVAMLLEWREASPRTHFQLAIALREGGGHIGNCGVRRASADARVADFGCELDPRYWKRGYAVEAGRAVVGFAFRELGVHRVWAECIEENRASALMLERIGMPLEGRLRESQWFKGRWWSTCLYGMLENEWNEARLP